LGKNKPNVRRSDKSSYKLREPSILKDFLNGVWKRSNPYQYYQRSWFFNWTPSWWAQSL